MPVWCGGAAGGAEEVSNKYQMGKLQSTGPLAKKLAVHGTIFGQPAAHGTFRNFSAVHGTAPNFPAVHGTAPFLAPSAHGTARNFRQSTGPPEISDSPRDRPKFRHPQDRPNFRQPTGPPQIWGSPRDRPKFPAVHGTGRPRATRPASPLQHAETPGDVQSRSTIKRTGPGQGVCSLSLQPQLRVIS